MSIDLLFVHGTGVRKESFNVSYQLISRQLTRFGIMATLKPCYWGDEGAELRLNGASIPDYRITRDVGVPANVAFWLSLYRDPLLELRQIASGPRSIDPADSHTLNSRRQIVRDALRSLRFDEELQASLKLHGHLQFWRNALDDVRQESIVEQVLDSSVRLDFIVEALVRSIAALAISNSRQIGLPTMSSETRDALIQHLTTQIKDEIRTLHDRKGQSVVQSIGNVGKQVSSFYREYIADPVKAHAWNVGASWATSRIADRRRSIADSASPIAGDVLLYQARGERIRSRVADCIRSCETPPIVLAHSLGGIISVDVLASVAAPQVAKLVTVGTQVPLLYELGALVSLTGSQQLPSTFPPWLNIFDRNDLLSFAAEKVFRGQASDFRTESGQPFPESHNAYWDQDSFWVALRKFLEPVGTIHNAGQ